MRKMIDDFMSMALHSERALHGERSSADRSHSSSFYFCFFGVRMPTRLFAYCIYTRTFLHILQTTTTTTQKAQKHRIQSYQIFLVVRALCDATTSVSSTSNVQRPTSNGSALPPPLPTKCDQQSVDVLTDSRAHKLLSHDYPRPS